MNRRTFLQRSGVIGGFTLVGTPFLLSRLADVRPTVRVERVYIAMGTTVRFLVFHEDESEAVAAIHDAQRLVQDIHALMSIQESTSELSRWNQSTVGLSTPFHPLTASAIDQAISHVALTEGRFDPTVGAAVDAALSGHSPILQHDRLGDWNLLERRLRKPHPSVHLDLGGSAKGWAVDRAVEILTRRGMTSGLVNAGGDLRVFGRPPGEAAWSIGVRHPLNPDDILAELMIADCSVATSGSYESEGSLIVDPRDTHRVDFEGSVTVLAPTCGAADCLSTALFVDRDANIIPPDAHGIVARISGDEVVVSQSRGFPEEMLSIQSSERPPHHTTSR